MLATPSFASDKWQMSSYWFVTLVLSSRATDDVNTLSGSHRQKATRRDRTHPLPVRPFRAVRSTESSGKRVVLPLLPGSHGAVVVVVVLQYCAAADTEGRVDTLSCVRVTSTFVHWKALFPSALYDNGAFVRSIGTIGKTIADARGVNALSRNTTVFITATANKGRYLDQNHTGTSGRVEFVTTVGTVAIVIVAKANRTTV
jgi:hypothetical protein